MAIRLHAAQSPVYHLQAPGHPYYETRCGRTWVRPSVTDGEGRQYPRMTLMPEISEHEIWTQQLRLCKKCERHFRDSFSYELYPPAPPPVRCDRCGEADRSKGDHGLGRCVPMSQTARHD